MNEEEQRILGFLKKLMSDDKDYDTLHVVVYRGAILHIMMILETNMEDLIAAYFCGGNKRSVEVEFMDVFFSKEHFSMSLKNDVVGYILKKDHKDILKKYGKDHPIKDKKNNIIDGSLLTDLGELIKFRNKIAHKKYLNTKNEKSFYLENNSISSAVPTELVGIELNDDVVLEMWEKAVNVSFEIFVSCMRTSVKNGEEKRKAKA